MQPLKKAGFIVILPCLLLGWSSCSTLFPKEDELSSNRLPYRNFTLMEPVIDDSDNVLFFDGPIRKRIEKEITFQLQSLGLNSQNNAQVRVYYFVLSKDASLFPILPYERPTLGSEVSSISKDILKDNAVFVMDWVDVGSNQLVWRGFEPIPGTLNNQSLIAPIIEAILKRTPL